MALRPAPVLILATLVVVSLCHAAPVAKKPAPVAKKSPPVAKKPPPAVPLPPGQARVNKLLAALQRLKLNTYVSRVKLLPGYNDYLRGSILGYGLTLFVASDLAWAYSSKLAGNQQYQIMQYNTFYGSYNAADLAALTLGARLLTLDNKLSIYKIAGNAFSGNAQDTTGVKVLKGNAYYDSTLPGRPIVVHTVDAVLFPPKFF